MPLWRRLRSLARIGMPLLGLALLTGCAKDVVRLDKNRPPRTFIVAAPLDSTGNAQASGTTYRVHLYWRGEDDDGYVVGFLWAFDDSSLSAFRYTTKTDSIFELLVNDSTALTGTTNPGTSRYHTFFIRSVDNLGKLDPSISVFNRRTFNASTKPPTARFVGGLPSGLVAIDTLSDGKPFEVCWSGTDSDGVVSRYMYQVGTYTSPIGKDTCAYFNDPSNPKAIGLPSGIYTMTVRAIDNADAVGKVQFAFVVNHDPETWFLPVGSPLGHYIQPFLEGNPVNLTGTFAPGDTVPYRSTVWWDWDGADTTGGEANILTGWSVVFTGNRNNGDPYSIGFLDTLCTSPSVVRFKTNNPAVVGPCGFRALILDSLDAGYDLTLFLRSRDGSFRRDGSPATFTFNCDFTPKLLSFSVRDTLAQDPIKKRDNPGIPPEPCKYLYWSSYDYEDGTTKSARLTIDGSLNFDMSNWEHDFIVAVTTFQSLSPGATEGSAKIRVADRADIFIPKEEELEIRFPIP